MKPRLLFATRSRSGLGRDVAAAAGLEVGETEVSVWPDGEIYQRVITPVPGREVALVAGSETETETLEAFDLACALLEQGARSLSVAISFFGYSTMERASRAGEAVTAKSRARLWSALPAAETGKRILLLEPHTPGLPHYFGGNLSVSALDARPLLSRMLEGFSAAAPVLCSPDIGRIKWVDGLASRMGWPSAFLLKRRTEKGALQSFGLSGEVEGRTVVICDDMVRTGGTLLNAARACLDAGAADVSAVAIHGAFSPGAARMLRESGLIHSLKCSDSHPHARASESEWLKVESCAGILAAGIVPGPGTPEA